MTDLMQVRRIPGYSNYSVTRDGRVLSHARLDTREIAQKDNGQGYMICRIKTDDGVWKWRKVHRLVALAFIGPALDHMEVCHSNGDRADNRVENLRWDTRKNNIKDRKHYAPGKIGQPQKKLTEDEAREIKAELLAGVTGEAIAKKWGISIFHVSNIKNGRAWKNA